ncbi:MAG: mandelate racemase/muconate lactonizing enzyme family protein [Dehalococcoidia bacterium]|nr:mandelate racemase/muconate lactonizing enzyme family protein [Dehalococcoidia bacterium]
MKITKVTPWLVSFPWEVRTGVEQKLEARDRQLVFVQVDTDEGITGWGEVTTYPGPVANRAMVAMIGQVSDFLAGENANEFERLWQRIFRSFTYVGTRGATTAMISAIDIALWDIRGKELGLPIYELLGGPVRDRIALYTHPPEPRTIPDAIADAQQIIDAGYEAFKFDPMMRFIPGGNDGFMDGQLSREGIATADEIVGAVREAIGPDIEILIDAHGMYNVPTAIELANRLAKHDIHWFEEPVPVESYSALRQVRREISVKISVGERLHTRWEFVNIFENNLADFVMPDVTWTGGITELKKISTMAEAYYVPVSPHDASGPVNVLAGAHVMMTTPNFYKLETSRYDLSAYDVFIEPGLDIRNGDLYVPDTPGLGIEMDMDYMRSHVVFGGE